MTPLDRLLVDGPLALTTALARRLLDTAPDAILLVRPDGTVAFANERAERLFGYSREELAGLGLEDLVPERFRAAHERHRAEFLENPTWSPSAAGRSKARATPPTVSA